VHPESGPVVVGFGEALFDVFPYGKILGGAPLNFAIHADQLLRPLGGAGFALSRVGEDPSGREIREQLENRGMSTRHVQIDPEHPTGSVQVSFRGSEPVYDILRGVAWDHIEWDPEVSFLARNCSGVCFGTLAQRTAETRESLQRFLDTAAHALRLFDVNLRQAYYSADLLDRSCRQATVVKLNEHELSVVAEALQLSFMPRDADRCVGDLMERYRLQAAALTRGPIGTVLYTREGRFESRVPFFPAEPNADSVGAGDACSAGLAVGFILGWEGERIVALANAIGAYTAACAGATPKLPESITGLVADPSSEATRCARKGQG
jgi:fructokinase